ncbi:N-fatty-acyl-amino acid synthase/hydrolase PM20D1.2-like [Ptychodera flava]|uniref:N-fatty-acyl-amino acid synthase/hydrolase PM20D1.2-like n=1 Tax=Ptychodera flava TaxID=63121 RepID=UPI00396A0B85
MTTATPPRSRTSRQLSLALFALVFLLVLAVVLRTVTTPSKQPVVQECSPYDTDFIAANDRLKRNFQKAITFKTVSYDQSVQNTEELSKFVDFLREVFPTVHSSPLVKNEVIGNYSLLYTVAGSNDKLKPYILAAHMDVVPVDGQAWNYPTFEGLEEDGFIYGRGTIDDKHCLMGIMEALEFRLQRGENPKRPLYIALGHDEEVSGFEGALSIAQTLAARDVDIEFMLDEGMTVLDGVVPMVPKKTALIGVVEKGYLTVRAVLNTSNTGHSSMPPKHTCIGKLAMAIARLEANPFPNMFGKGPERSMFDHLAPEMTLLGRVVMSNLWLFSPIVSWVLSWKQNTNAVIRTTTAVTKFESGIKENVIPSSASATINHRIHPAQTVQQVYDYDNHILNEVMVNDEEKIQVEMLNFLEPSHISPYDDDSFGYQTVVKSIRQVFPDVVVAPGVMIGNTDTRHYWNLTKNIYRFSPTIMKPTDLPRFHGVNERISIHNYEQVVNFFYHLMLNTDQEKLDLPHSHSAEL